MLSLPNGHPPLSNRAIGTAPDSPPGASAHAQGRLAPRPGALFVAPILSSFSRTIFVCERPVISSVRCKTGNGAATRVRRLEGTKGF